MSLLIKCHKSLHGCMLAYSASSKKNKSLSCDLILLTLLLYDVTMSSKLVT